MPKVIRPGPGKCFWPVDAVFAAKYRSNGLLLSFPIEQERKLGFLTQARFSSIFAPTDGVITKVWSEFRRGNFSFSQPAIEITGLTTIENTETTRRGNFETRHIIGGIDLTSLSVGEGQEVKAGQALATSNPKNPKGSLYDPVVEYSLTIAGIDYSPLEYLKERGAEVISADVGGDVSASEVVTLVTIALGAYIAYKLG